MGKALKVFGFSETQYKNIFLCPLTVECSTLYRAKDEQRIERVKTYFFHTFHSFLKMEHPKHDYSIVSDFTKYSYYLILFVDAGHNCIYFFMLYLTSHRLLFMFLLILLVLTHYFMFSYTNPLMGIVIPYIGYYAS